MGRLAFPYAFTILSSHSQDLFVTKLGCQKTLCLPSAYEGLSSASGWYPLAVNLSAFDV